MTRCVLPPAVSSLLAATVLTLPAMAQDPPGQPDPTVVSAEARTVLDRAIAAMGGQAALDAVVSVEFECNLEGANGTLAMKVSAMNGVGVRVEQSLTPTGADAPVRRQLLVANPTLGWASDLLSGGTQSMPGGVRASLSRAADLWNGIRSGMGQFALVEHSGAAVFAGRACTKLRFTQPRSQALQELTMFFDDETGLPLGQETSTAVETLISGTARIDEWQTVGGLLVPKKLAIEGQTGSSTLTFGTIAFNTVSESAFAQPADGSPDAGAE